MEIGRVRGIWLHVLNLFRKAASGSSLVPERLTPSDLLVSWFQLCSLKLFLLPRHSSEGVTVDKHLI